MWLVTYSDGTTEDFSDEMTLELLVDAYVDNRKSVVKIEKVCERNIFTNKRRV